MFSHYNDTQISFVKRDAEGSDVKFFIWQLLFFGHFNAFHLGRFFPQDLDPTTAWCVFILWVQDSHFVITPLEFCHHSFGGFADGVLMI